MAIRSYVARTLSGNRPVTMRFTLKSGETFKRGDPVTMDSNEDVLEVSGTDPATILGFAAENAADVVETGYVLVWVANDDTVFAISGDNAPTADDVNQQYGIVESGGIWVVDGTDTTNKRFEVLDIDTNQNLYFVTVLPDVRILFAGTTP